MRGPILIVESDGPTGRWLHEVLSDLGHPLEVVLHGHAALMLASSVRPDAVVMDVQLDDGSGLDVLRDMQTLDRSVAVVMLSPAHDHESAEAAMRAGALACLRKPVGASALRRAVTLALARSGAHARLASVMARTGTEATVATPFDATEQICPACGNVIADVTRGVAYERGLYHTGCWLQQRRQRRA